MLLLFLISLLFRTSSACPLGPCSNCQLPSVLGLKDGAICPISNDPEIQNINLTAVYNRQLERCEIPLFGCAIGIFQAVLLNDSCHLVHDDRLICVKGHFTPQNEPTAAVKKIRCAGG